MWQRRQRQARQAVGIPARDDAEAVDGEIELQTSTRKRGTGRKEGTGLGGSRWGDKSQGCRDEERHRQLQKQGPGARHQPRRHHPRGPRRTVNQCCALIRCSRWAGSQAEGHGVARGHGLDGAHAPASRTMREKEWSIFYKKIKVRG
jgi:hypothetical protein